MCGRFLILSRLHGNERVSEMGVLKITLDSFSRGGLLISINANPTATVVVGITRRANIK